MIYTSSYDNCNTDKYNKILIANDMSIADKVINATYPKLIPRKELIDRYNKNKGIMHEIDNDKDFIREYYRHVLLNLDINKTYEDLYGSILLSNEAANEFSHRHIVAAWFEILLKIKVPEISIEDDRIVTLERLEYIKEILETLIRGRNVRFNIAQFNNIVVNDYSSKEEYTKTIYEGTEGIVRIKN